MPFHPPYECHSGPFSQRTEREIATVEIATKAAREAVRKALATLTEELRKQ